MDYSLMAGPKKTSSKKMSNAPVAPAVAPVEPVVAPAVVPEPVALEAPAAAGETEVVTPDLALELSNEIADIEQVMQSLASTLTALSKRVRKLDKSVASLLKHKTKKVKVAKKEVPAKIDDRLMKFMGLLEPFATRSEVLRNISAYVRSHKLQIPDDKRTFKTDTTLASLFSVKKDEKLTFLAINKHITPLFVSPLVKDASTKKAVAGK